MLQFLPVTRHQVQVAVCALEPWLGQSCQRGAFCVNRPSAEKERESYLE